MKLSRVAMAAMALTVLISVNASARTDVQAKVEQMRENVSASKNNLQQYETNLGAVVSNLGETDRALKTIKRQKSAI